MTRMTTRVILFAGLRDAVGSDTVELELDTGATASGLWDLLETAHPSAVPYRDRVAFAVNNKIISPADELDAGVEVAILPPISGG